MIAKQTPRNVQKYIIYRATNARNNGSFTYYPANIEKNGINSMALHIAH